jgi:DNA (cytosine-5)-methyltransferase 1
LHWTYYNDADYYCCQWLCNLMEAELISPGMVDCRPIQEVQPGDLREFARVHMFAGIGGWELALRLAEWPDEREAWTGSCPCQPFSGAGKGAGFDDERHLWPEWLRVIRECRPQTVLGEQVAAAIRHEWLDSVLIDLEAEGYACGAAVLPACSVGAPHIRDRLWFVADAKSGNGRLSNRSKRKSLPEFAGRGETGELGDAIGPRLQEQRGNGSLSPSASGADQRQAIERANPWLDLEWLLCTDGKARPTKPNVFPLAPRLPGRVGKLRALGNAIVPALAAEFIKTVMEIRP